MFDQLLEFYVRAFAVLLPAIATAFAATVADAEAARLHLLRPGSNLHGNSAQASDAEAQRLHLLHPLYQRKTT